MAIAAIVDTVGNILLTQRNLSSTVCSYIAHTRPLTTPRHEADRISLCMGFNHSIDQSSSHYTQRKSARTTREEYSGSVERGAFIAGALQTTPMITPLCDNELHGNFWTLYQCLLCRSQARNTSPHQIHHPLDNDLPSPQ